MFVFKPTTKTYSDPVSATFIPGIPFGHEKAKGDICLLHEGFAASKIFLNSNVLREAMLNSKDFLEEILNIKITDKAGKEPAKIDVDTKDLDIYEPENIKIPEVPKDGMLEEGDLEAKADEETTVEEPISVNVDSSSVVLDTTEETPEVTEESESDIIIKDIHGTVTAIDSSDLSISASPLPASDYTVTANTDVLTTETATESKPKKKTTKK